ncbi:MAG: hypothetical protein AAFY00_13365 [Bacteroidota bacterium]
MKNLFTEWYLKQIEKELSLNKRIEYINIQFNLATIQPLHAEWGLFNFTTILLHRMGVKSFSILNG